MWPADIGRLMGGWLADVASQATDSSCDGLEGRRLLMGG